MAEWGHQVLSISEQCSFLNINHSGFYYVSAIETGRNLSIMNAIDRIHTDYPFYGFRRIKTALQDCGFFVGKKLIIRLVKLMNIHIIYPKPETAVSSSDHHVYPCLLRGLSIEKIHQAWETDIWK